MTSEHGMDERLSRSIFDMARALENGMYVHESVAKPALALLREIADRRERQRYECHGPDCPGYRPLLDKYGNPT